MPDAEFILRIILRARDEMAGALAKARAELALLTNQSQAWRSELKRLNGELDNFFNRLDRFSKRATSNIKDEIQAHRQATSSSGVFAESIGKLGDEEQRTGQKIRSSTQEVRRGSSELRGAKREADNARNSIERLGNSMLNTSRNTKTWGDNVGATDNKLRGMIVAAALIFIQQLDTAVVGLGGGLFELASSAAMAGGALGGILAAGAAQALPTIGLLAAALHRVQMVWKVVQEQQKVDQQQAFRDIQGKKQQAGASDALANAQDGVAQAHRQVTIAEENLSKARGQAVRDIQDLNEAAKQSIIQAERASLAQEDARKALTQALEAGDIDAARRARLDLQDANNNAEKARITRQRAQQDANTANRQGVIRNPQVVAAQRALDDANRGVTQAARALQKARTDSQAANADMFAAKSALQYMLSQLSPAERRLYETLKRVQATYKAVFRPITDTIINSFDFAVNRAGRLLLDPRLLGAAGKLADSIGARIRGITTSFTDDRTIGQFAFFTQKAAENLVPLEKIAENIGHMFFDIAQDAMPAFDTFVETTDKWIGQWADWVRDNPEKVTQFFNEGEKHLEAWLTMAGSVIKLFAAITGAGGAEGGLKLLEKFTNSVNDATKWVDTHREKVREFFGSVNIVLDILANTLRVVAGAMLELFSPDRLQNFAQFFNHVLLPAVESTAKSLGLVADLFLQLSNIPGLRQLLIALITVTLTVKALRGPWDLLLGGIGKGVKGLGGFMATMKTAWIAIQAFFKADVANGLVGRFGSAKKAVQEYEGAQKAALVQTEATTAVVKEQQIVESTPIFGPKGNVISTVKRGGVAAAEGTAAKTAVGTATREAATVVEGSLIRGIGGAIGGLALGGLGIGAAMGVINGLGDTFSSKANQLDFGGHVQEFLHGATFGIIPSAADEQAALYVKSLGNAVKGRFATPEVRRQFTPPKPQPVDNSPSGIARATLGGNLSATPISQRRAPTDAADLADPFHRLSDGQRQTIRDLAMLRKSFDELRAAGATSFGSLGRELEAYAKKYPQAQGAVDELLQHIERYQKRVNSIAKAQSLVFDFSNALQLDPKHAKRTADNFIDELKKLSPRARIEAVKSAKSVVAGLESQGVLTHSAAKKIDDTVSGALAHMRRRARNQSAAAAKETSKNIGIMLNSVGLMNRDFVTGINKILDGLGVNKKAAAQWAGIAVRALPGGVGETVGGLLDLASGGGQATGGRARGWIGKAGQRGKDTVVSVLGKGEAVLNWAHQRMVEPALRQMYGIGLDDMFRMRDAYHAGGPGQPGFAGGGVVVGSGVNMSVGQEPKILAALYKLANELKQTVYVISGWRSPQHSVSVGGFANDPHTRGQAADIGVGSAMRSSMARVSEAALRHVGLYRPFYPADPKEINHIQLIGSGGGAAGAIAGLAGAVAKAVNTKLKKMRHVPGDGPVAAIANRMIDRVNKAGQNFVDRNAGTGGLDFSGFAGGGDNSANRLLGKRMMSRFWHLDQWPFLDKLIHQESGWSTTARNPSSGAFGIGQFLGSTLTQYAKFGATSHNPVKQIAAMLKYVKDRYGSPARAWAHEVANNWYDKGGEIPGPWGTAINAVVHAGEWILNKAQQSRLAKLLGMNRDSLRQSMGFAGGPSSFAGGGEVEDASVVKRILNLLLLQSGRFAAPNNLQFGRTNIGEVQGITGSVPLNFNQLKNSIRDVEKSLRGFDVKGSKGVKSVERSLVKLNSQGGLFDKLSGAVDAMQKAMTRNLNARAFIITKAGKVVQRMSTSQIHAEELNNLIAGYDGLVGERGVLQKALKDNAAQIREAEHQLRTAKSGAQKSAARKAIADLRGFRTSIVKRIDDVNDDIQQNMQDRLQAQIQVQQDIVDGINKAFSQRSDTLNSAQRIATALGQTSISKTVSDAQVELLKNQRDALQSRIQAARDAGANDLADQLTSQVQDLNATIVETIQQNIQNAIDQINNNATRRLGRLDLLNRMADAMGRVGLGGAGVTVGGTTLTRGGVFDERNNILVKQQQDLQAQLDAQNRLPGDQQNLGIIQALGDQIDELTVAIKENTKASFTARIDAVNNAADFALNINDLNKQLLEATAAANGTTADTGAIAKLLSDRAGILADQWTKLNDLLTEATNNGDQQAMNDLQTQLLQNQIAQQQNTQALNEVNGSLNVNQLSSTAWQQFRTAIFTSMGNLLPQYQIPAMGTPSMWAPSTSTSKAAPVQQTVNEGDTNVYVTEPMEVLDPDYVAHRIAFERGGSGGA